jgi:uncharacterized protein (TIGR00255 family)
MTGYGAAALESEGLLASVTIRSLNHRYLDVALHLSRRLASLEPEIKERLKGRLHRGRVELSLSASFPAPAVEAVVAPSAEVARVVRRLREIQSEHRLDGGVMIADVLRFPGIVEAVEVPAVLAPEKREAILELVDTALGGVEGMRRAEGERLESELGRRLAAVEGGLARIEGGAEAAKAAGRQALAERVRDLGAELGLDDARVYQEVVRAVERHDVSEEVQRLRSHVAMVRELLAGNEPAGKRLDFLAQEMMREANTIGSKIAEADLVREVVALKHEVEALREQVQNVE